MVVYQADSEANSDDEGIMKTLLTWLEFTHPNSLNMEIQKFSNQSPNIILKVPGLSDLNINNIVGALGLDNLSMKDNISQFVNIKLFKSSLDRTKLSTYVDTNFAELTPQTFVHLIEQYQKLKKKLPFYRYRIEDFFEELGEEFPSNIPPEYIISKFFELVEILIF